MASVRMEYGKEAMKKLSKNKEAMGEAVTKEEADMWKKELNKRKEGEKRKENRKAIPK